MGDKNQEKFTKGRGGTHIGGSSSNESEEGGAPLAHTRKLPASLGGFQGDMRGVGTISLVGVGDGDMDEGRISDLGSTPSGEDAQALGIPGK